MRYLSLFSGIEACTVAWHPLGWEAVAFAEFEDFPKAVLAHHWPDVPDLDDVTKITEEQIAALGPIDLVVGGSPCQDLSVAGTRAGLRTEDGEVTRSGLFDEQVRIFEIARRRNGARYLLWENVPGAFSSNGGADFAYVLGSLVGRGVSVPDGGWKTAGICVGPHGHNMVEWRTLDAQYFGVPQRRRRIFALLDTGAWWSRGPILFEPEGGSRDFTKSEGAGQGVAAGVGEGVADEAVIYENHGTDARITPCESVSPTVLSRWGTGGNNVPLVRDEVAAFDMRAFGEYGCGRKDATDLVVEQKPICFLERAGKPGGGKGILMSEDKTFTLSTLDHMRVSHEEEPSNDVVRRFTPMEAERLQGFPDGYTDIPWNGQPHAPDSRRYKALGNSMAVPVMRWIGERLENSQAVERDDEAIERILYTPDLEDGQLGLF